MEPRPRPGGRKGNHHSPKCFITRSVDGRERLDRSLLHVLLAGGFVLLNLG